MLVWSPFEENAASFAAKRENDKFLPGIPLPGETTASTTNRNFDRRMGGPGPVWLVSPAVAAAAAVRGRLCDPRTL